MSKVLTVELDNGYKVFSSAMLTCDYFSVRSLLMTSMPNNPALKEEMVLLPWERSAYINKIKEERLQTLGFEGVFQ